MRKIFYLAAVLTLILSSAATSPSLAQDQKETGTITGHVKLNGKPAAGITIIVTQSVSDVRKTVEQMFSRPAPVKAVTDSDGFYRVEGLAPGKYDVEPASPTMVVSEDNPDEIVVAEGGTTENIDFALSPGGVITGRITDADGRPVIGEIISVNSFGRPTGSAGLDSMVGDNLRMYATDDRGIYRIYGLNPGSYIVSAGKQSNMMSVFSQRPKRVQTFYPSVTDETRAKPVQVNAGAEATGIDIQLSLNDKGFTITGRVVDAEKNTPIANAMIAYSKVRRVTGVKSNDPDGDTDVSVDIGDVAAFGGLGAFTSTNDKGEFKFASVLPGSYKLEATSLAPFASGGGSQFYADPVTFEVAASNVEKLDIKVHRGCSINGIVVVESGGQQDSLDRYGQLMLMAMVTNSSSNIPVSPGNCLVGADGSFRIGGLRPGKVTIRPYAIGGKQLGVVRVERNGVDVKEDFEIQPDEEVSGLRVVMTLSAGIVRGRVVFAGGPAPPNARLEVRARSATAESTDVPDFFNNKQTSVDPKGNFSLEGLAPGTYIIEAFGVATGSRPQTLSATQTVIVTNERPVDVELTIDLRSKDRNK